MRPKRGRAGKEIFAEALAAGTATSFFSLIEVFSTQDEPAFCGLASLAMILNSLAIGGHLDRFAQSPNILCLQRGLFATAHRPADPRRPWKGPWRWFAEALLDCCAPLATVKSEGITLSQVSH